MSGTEGPAYVRVDREHIDCGVPKNPNLCPIAIAAREQLPGAGLSIVALVEDAGGRREARLIAGGVAFTLVDQEGMEATEFLMRFDERRPVEPAVYYVQRYIADGEERQKWRLRLRDREPPLTLLSRFSRFRGA